MNSTEELNKNAEDLLSEINTLLSQIKQQQGGDVSLISEINNLLSEQQGTEVNLTEQQLVSLAEQRGGKKHKKNKKSKKSKKSKSKKSRSKKSKSKKSKSKKSRSKKSRISRAGTSEQDGGEEKKKRKPNKAFMDMVALKKWLREDELKSENLNYILMGKPVSILYNKNNKSVKQSKNNFNKKEFMEHYREAENNKKTKSKKK